MRSLSRRLSRMESQFQPHIALGAYEIHYINAWPDCENYPGIQRCEEHAPTCGLLSSPMRSPGRDVLILRGTPWLGLD